MPLLFRGVAFGSHWQIHDATASGFTPHIRGTPHSINMMMMHIVGATPVSPYMSLTSSYAVAYSYAAGVTASTGTVHLPTPANPGYVYFIDIPDPLPPHAPHVQLFDPVKEIGAMAPLPPTQVPYQHEGKPEYLLGIVDPRRFHRYMRSYRLGAGGQVTSRPDTPSQHLLTLVCALRDAELLAYDYIPPDYVVHRIPVP